MASFFVVQAVQWVRLIQWRRHVLYPTPVLLWSLFFGGRIFQLGVPQSFQWGALVVLLLYLVAGLLLFPVYEGMHYKNRHTYLDVYEQLRQQRFWVFGAALLAEFGIYYWDLADFAGGGSVAALLLAAMLTEHKGLMLCWVWLGLAGLYWIW
jgi:hypothetical protein